jgi:hypothetical protein
VSIARSITRPSVRSITSGVTSRIGDAPTLDLGFGAQGGFPPGLINYSRASPRTLRRAVDGLMVTLAPNQFATDHDVNGDPLGLPLEGSRTNLQIHSEALDNVVWTGVRTSTIIADQALGPDGVLNLEEIIEDSGTGTHYHRYNFVSGIGFNDVVTASYFVRANTRTFATIRCSNLAQTNPVAMFNLNTGVVEADIVAGFVDKGIEDWGGGLYRIWVSVDQGAVGTGAVFFGLGLAPSATIDSYIGDGSSSILGGFCQVELGAFPSSYIKTEGTAATREADSVIITDLSWLNENQGTFLINGVLIDYIPSTTDRIMALQNDAGTQTQDYYWAGGTPANVNFYDGVSHILSTGAFTPGASFSFAAAYAVDDIVAIRDGGTPVASFDTGGALPSGFTKLVIGNSGNGSRSMYGTIERIRYWPRRLPNSDLIFLTR